MTLQSCRFQVFIYALYASRKFKPEKHFTATNTGACIHTHIHVHTYIHIIHTYTQGVQTGKEYFRLTRWHRARMETVQTGEKRAGRFIARFRVPGRRFGRDTFRRGGWRKRGREERINVFYALQGRTVGLFVCAHLSCLWTLAVFEVSPMFPVPGRNLRARIYDRILYYRHWLSWWYPHTLAVFPGTTVSSRAETVEHRTEPRVRTYERISYYWHGLPSGYLRRLNIDLVQRNDKARTGRTEYSQ